MPKHLWTSESAKALIQKRKAEGTFAESMRRAAAKSAITRANWTDEQREALSKKRRGRTPWNKDKKGDKKHSEEHKKRLAEMNRARWAAYTPEEREQIRQRMRQNRGKHPSPMKGRKHSEITRERMRAAQNKPEALERASRTFKMNAQRQSGPEAALQKVLDGRAWRFVGAGKLRSGAANPHWQKYETPISADFIHPKAKAIILVDGCFWHECPEHGKKRFPNKSRTDRLLTEKAKSAGWIVIRLWEHELSSVNKVLSKVNSGLTRGL